MSDPISSLADSASNAVQQGVQQAESSTSAGQTIGQASAVGGAVAAGTAATVGVAATGILGATAASAASAVTAAAASAASAFGISTAIGSAIPIPLLGTAIGAVVGAFTALGIAIKSAFTDTFAPDRQQSSAWLLAFQFAPGLMFSGIDTDTATTGSMRPFDDASWHAIRLYRYLELAAGIVPNPSGIMYNPNSDGYRALPTDSPKTNPFIESHTPAPGRPLTNHKHVKPIENAVKAAGYATPWTIAPELKTPIQASAALKLLRGPHFQASGILDWSQLTDPKNRGGFIAAVRRVRILAGESGPDPVLSALLGGDVTVYQPPPGVHPVRPHGKYASTVFFSADGRTVQTFANGAYKVFNVDGSATMYDAAGMPAGAEKKGTYAAPPPAAVLGKNVDYLNTDPSWWWVGLTTAAGLILGGGLVWWDHRHASGGVNFASEDPGRAAFERVLRDGIVDGELHYDRRVPRDMLYFHKAFNDARVLGVSPTTLAATGRYFGAEPDPIELDVYPDGGVHLADGRRRYMAAKAAGAREILARVALRDGDGVASRVKLAVVRLV